jgi:hypothetical protein
MLILLRVRLSNKKVRQSATLDILSSLGRAHTDDIETKPAVVPAFVQFRLEFGETEILSDLSRDWEFDGFGQ